MRPRLFNYIAFLILTFQYFIDGYSQNLITNPSFENYVNCPDGLSRIYPEEEAGPVFCLDWSRPTDGTTDYFHTCATLPSVGIPDNFFGYQYPRTGQAYIGLYPIYDFADPTTGELVISREYIQGRLSTSLISGHRYFCNYWVSASDNRARYSIDRLGAYFSTDATNAFGFSGVLPLTDISFISEEGHFFDDVTNWMPVSGFFEAEGGEGYILIGNFFDFDETNLSLLNPAITADLYNAYYYVDDVCLLDLDGAPYSSTVNQLHLCDMDDTLLTSNYDGLDLLYVWSDGSTGESLAAGSPGTYWVNTIDRQKCRLHTDTFHIDILQINIDGMVHDTVICKGQKLRIGSRNPYAVSYLWNTGDTDSIIEVNGRGVYFVEVEMECRTLVDSYYVDVIDSIYFYLPEDTMICREDKLILTPTNIYGYDIMFQWSNGWSSLSIPVEEKGTYFLTGSDMCGNIYTAGTIVDIIRCDNCLLLPNAFSPNKDGLNDVFSPQTICSFKTYQLTIYDRWGQLIFVSHVPAVGWDGTIYGKDAEAGVYFYRIYAESAYNPTTIVLMGDITLIR